MRTLALQTCSWAQVLKWSHLIKHRHAYWKTRNSMKQGENRENDEYINRQVLEEAYYPKKKMLWSHSTRLLSPKTDTGLEKLLNTADEPTLEPDKQNKATHFRTRGDREKQMHVLRETVFQMQEARQHLQLRQWKFVLGAMGTFSSEDWANVVNFWLAVTY